MLKIIGIIVVILVVAVVALLAYAATKPDTFTVKRAAAIKAPPEKIFALVNDLRSHALWSPWEKKDPAMKKSYSGAASGEGAVYEWDGNKNIGKGRMEITETSPPSKVTLKLDFLNDELGESYARIPNNYISDTRLRIQAYRKIALAL